MRRFRLFISALMVLVYLGCTSHPVIETVTTDAGRASALPAGAQPIAREPNLPARNADMEAAGDRVAEAVTYLNSKRRDRRDVALHALNQAEATINHAIKNNGQSEAIATALHSILRDLDNAERAVQRSAPDSIKQLTSINKSLDEVNKLAGKTHTTP